MEITTQTLCFNIAHLDESAYARLYQQASSYRRQKADRYLRREDKLRCIAADALLRYALGGGDFTEVREGCGKPYLQNRPDFHYNLSHSGPWVVLAFGAEEVGIDVEETKMDAGKEKLARRYFTQAEQDYIFHREEGRDIRFFEIWTAKESYVKYLGTGLQKSLSSFDVISMESPHFHTRRLGNCTLTLCTNGSEICITEVTLPQLLAET